MNADAVLVYRLTGQLNRGEQNAVIFHRLHNPPD
jgi:hypothetical protein